MSRNLYLTVFWYPLFEVFPGFVWLKLHSEVILILTSDTFTSKNVLYINCLKKNKEYSGFKENLQFLAENDISLVKIYQRSRRDRGAIAVKIAQRFWPDFAARSLRYSRSDGSDRGAIAVINRLAFLAGFRGAMRAIAQRSLSSIAQRFWPDFAAR